MRRCLRRDGYLLVGGGETSLVLDRTFEAVRSGKSVFYRIRSADRARVSGPDWRRAS